MRFITRGLVFLLIITFAFMLLAGCRETHAASPPYGPYVVKVTRVLDGDTVEISGELWPGITVLSKVRFVGVNAPELHGGKPCEKAAAQLAKKFVDVWVTARTEPIVLIVFGTDKYGRLLGQLVSGKQDIANDLLAAGLARPYKGEARKAWC